MKMFVLVTLNSIYTHFKFNYEHDAEAAFFLYYSTISNCSRVSLACDAQIGEAGG